LSHADLSKEVTRYLLAVHASDFDLAKTIAVDAASLESPGRGNLADFVLELATRFVSIVRQQADLEDVGVGDLLLSLDEALKSEVPGNLRDEYREALDALSLAQAMARDDRMAATLILGSYDDASRLSGLMMGLATGTLSRAAVLVESRGVGSVEEVLRLTS
jgi:hypothetical protein